MTEPRELLEWKAMVGSLQQEVNEQKFNDFAELVSDKLDDGMFLSFVAAEGH